MAPGLCVRVDGMTCNGCVTRVHAALTSLPGARAVSVDLASGLATLEYAGPTAALVAAVADTAGKVATVLPAPPLPAPSPPAAPRPVTLHVHGMTSTNCAERVTRALVALETAADVVVDLDAGLASLTFVGEDEALVRAVAGGADMTATVVGGMEKAAAGLEGATEAPRRSRRVTLSVSGMTCMGCVGRVRDAIAAVDTAADVVVELEAGLATLTYAGDDDALVTAVKEGAGKVASVLPNSASASHALDQVDLSSPMVQGDTSSSASGPRLDATREELAVRSGDVEPSAKAALTTTTQLRVGGMTCSSCVGVVEGLLSGMPGVTSARVNLLAGRATVVHDGAVVVAQALASAVMSAGYECLVLDTSEAVQGARSGGGNVQSKFRIIFPTDVQAQNALKALRFTSGVDSVDVIGCTAAVTLSPNFPKSAVLRRLESDGGYGKLIVKRSLAAERAAEARGDNLSATEVIDEEARTWRRRFQLSIVFIVPIMLLSFLHHRTQFPSMRVVQWLHFALATPVQFICGRGFYRASFYALRKGRATMDVLVALSTSIAYFSSAVVVILNLGVAGNSSLGHAALFNVSAMIITMVLVGKWLEASAKRRAAAGVAALSALTPEGAVLYDEREEVVCHTEVAVGTLDVGDVVRLIPGDRVPTDGEVIDGNSAVDESMLTGESNPVPKGAGDFVFGGTVNGRGSMLVRTTAVGADAVLSQIVKLVNDAQTSRAPIEAYADKVSAIFVPAVVSVSVAVFIGWYSAAKYGWIPHTWWEDEGEVFFALLFALETMVIACPCALGLATPTAVMVASEVGTGLGVLFRGGGAALEAAHNIKAVVFDKTGTLTVGKPEVAAVWVGKKGTGDLEQASVILFDLILLVEAESHHPLASAITSYIRERFGGQSGGSQHAYKLTKSEELPGRGMTAVVNKGEYSVRVGSREWAFGKDGGLERKLLTDAEISQIERMEGEDGLTVVAAVVNDSMVVVFGLEDTVRSEAEAIVSYLHHDLGVECHLLTGDSEESGRAVARRVGIAPEHIKARALPWTKRDYVKSLSLGRACFVGDGINDAPALAASSLGVAIGAGAPVAAESASVVLVRSDLRGVAYTLSLARATLRRVRINFIWAIGYNVLGMPLGAGVLYPYFGVRVPPLVASGAMALSSTCVVISSLALRLFRPPSFDLSSSHSPGVELRSRGQRAAAHEIEEMLTSSGSIEETGSLDGPVSVPLLGLESV